jgi:hypothetical protein
MASIRSYNSHLQACQTLMTQQIWNYWNQEFDIITAKLNIVQP